jgi:hypothetical protein
VSTSLFPSGLCRPPCVFFSIPLRSVLSTLCLLLYSPRSVLSTLCLLLYSPPVCAVHPVSTSLFPSGLCCPSCVYFSLPLRSVLSTLCLLLYSPPVCDSMSKALFCSGDYHACITSSVPTRLNRITRKYAEGKGATVRGNRGRGRYTRLVFVVSVQHTIPNISFHAFLSRHNEERSLK